MGKYEEAKRCAQKPGIKNAVHGYGTGRDIYHSLLAFTFEK